MSTTCGSKYCRGKSVDLMCSGNDAGAQEPREVGQTFMAKSLIVVDRVSGQ